MPGDKAGNEFASALLTFSQPPPSRSLVGQREVESIEEVEAPFDNLLVGPVHLSPAFQDQVDGHAFPAPELVVLEVRVVDDKFGRRRSEEHTSELQSLAYLVCRLLLEKKKKKIEY